MVVYKWLNCIQGITYILRLSEIVPAWGLEKRFTLFETVALLLNLVVMYYNVHVCFIDQHDLYRP